MSIGITLHCDRQLDRWSNCAAQEFVAIQPGETLESAIARLRARGWATSPDLCPQHSGRGPDHLWRAPRSRTGDANVRPIR